MAPPKFKHPALRSPVSHNYNLRPRHYVHPSRDRWMHILWKPNRPCKF
ncbi:hypothetical protein ACP70R_028644 [Stipagrostis hirtigluma subsp. patula]